MSSVFNPSEGSRGLSEIIHRILPTGTAPLQARRLAAQEGLRPVDVDATTLANESAAEGQTAVVPDPALASTEPADSGNSVPQPNSGNTHSLHSTLAHAVRVLASALSGLAGLGTLMLVCLTVGDVAGRQFFGSGIPGTIEIVEVGMVVVVFIGLMGAQVNGRHIHTPLLTNRLPSRAAHIVRMIALSIALFLLVWMTYETAILAVDSIERGEYRYGLVDVPVWPARLLIPIGLGAFALAMAMDLLRIAGQLLRGEAAHQHDVENNL